MSFQLTSSLDDLVIKWMLNVINYCNNDCLIHLITYYFTYTSLSKISLHDRVLLSKFWL